MPRTPTALKLLAGNPGHRPINQNEPQPKVGLGEPPAELDAAHRKIWRELSRSMPEGVFTVADRFLVEQACRLIVRMRSDSISLSQNAQLTGILGRLGMSPCDRSKVNAVAPKEQKQDEWSFAPNVRKASK